MKPESIRFFGECIRKVFADVVILMLIGTVMQVN